jgi:hypothetical protein
MANFNINTAGFVIVGMFILTWAGAILIWKYGNVEEKWSANLIHQTTPFQFEEDLAAQWENGETDDTVARALEPVAPTNGQGSSGSSISHLGGR